MQRLLERRETNLAVPVPKRLERQSTMTLREMLDDLPTDCDVGTKKNHLPADLRFGA